MAIKLIKLVSSAAYHWRDHLTDIFSSQHSLRWSRVLSRNYCLRWLQSFVLRLQCHFYMSV
jgi:hypothetical protein